MHEDYVGVVVVVAWAPIHHSMCASASLLSMLQIPNTSSEPAANQLQVLPCFERYISTPFRVLTSLHQVSMQSHQTPLSVAQPCGSWLAYIDEELFKTGTFLQNLRALKGSPNLRSTSSIAGTVIAKQLLAWLLLSKLLVAPMSCSNPTRPITSRDWRSSRLSMSSGASDLPCSKRASSRSVVDTTCANPFLQR